MIVHRSALTEKVIGCAIEVHRTLGPGLLESVYERCFAYELSLKSIAFLQEVPVPVNYKNIHLDLTFRADFLIENQLLVELKAVDKLHANCFAQTLTYLKLLRVPQALLINFNVPLLKSGLKSFVLGRPTRTESANEHGAGGL